MLILDALRTCATYPIDCPRVPRGLYLVELIAGAAVRPRPRCRAARRRDAAAPRGAQRAPAVSRSAPRGLIRCASLLLSRPTCFHPVRSTCRSARPTGKEPGPAQGWARPGLAPALASQATTTTRGHVALCLAVSDCLLMV